MKGLVLVSGVNWMNEPERGRGCVFPVVGFKLPPQPSRLAHDEPASRLASFILTSAGVRKRLRLSWRFVFRLCFLRSGWKRSWWFSFCFDFSGRREIFTVFLSVTSSTGTHWSGSLKTKYFWKLFTESRCHQNNSSYCWLQFGRISIYFFSLRGQRTTKICLYCSDVGG